jgi:type II secretory pathway component GspD/PulD (secretin)
MVFSETNVSTVLKAIGTRTGANVVYVGSKEKIPITINLTVNSAEEAVRSAVSAAGLSMRKVGSTYVVAPPDQMRQALEPYATRARFPIPVGSSERMMTMAKEAFPHATITVMNDEVSFKGLPEDVREAEAFFAGLMRSDNGRQATDMVQVGSLDPEEVAKVVTASFSDVKANALKGEGGRGAAVTLAGSEARVRAAREMVSRLASDRPADVETYQIYEIRYSSAPVLTKFLKEAVSDVEVVTGPEAYAPPRAVFQPIGSALQGGGNGAGGGSSSGGSSGGSSSSSSGGGSSSGGSGSGDLNSPIRTKNEGDRAKRLVLKGSTSRVNQALQLLAKLDTKPRQIMVEVNVIETTPEFKESLGLNHSWAPFKFFEAPKNTAFGDTFSTANATRPAGFGTMSRGPWSLQSLLQAESSKTDTKILANPKIQVTDNDGASIFIGDTVRVKIAQSGSLGSQTVDIREFPVGIILLINPRINADGNITMHVNPVISSITGVGADNIPQTSSREAETNVVVKDGESMVLGGLIRDEESKTISSIPLLSKLPLIGELFKNRSTSKKKTEVIVTITPHIIDDSKEESK